MQPMEKIRSQYRYRFTWFQLVRMMTLTGTISPILAGTALAAQLGEIRWTLVGGFLFASLLVQMAVNIFNDYFDFQKGQDGEKWSVKGVGPTYDSLPVVSGLLLAIAVVLGIWLAIESQGWIFLFGVIGAVAGFFYSAGKKPLSSIGLGELVAAVFLGIMVLVLAYAVQGAPINMFVFVFALPYAPLIASMILSNNIRDIKKDQGFRCTLPMVLGRRRAVILLTILIIFPYIWTISMLMLQIFQPAMLFVLLAAPFAVRLRWKFRVSGPRKDELEAMKWSALHHWVFGLLFALGILFS